MHTIDITNTIKVHYSATGKWVSVQVSLTQGKGEGWWQEGHPVVKNTMLNLNMRP